MDLAQRRMPTAVGAKAVPVSLEMEMVAVQPAGKPVRQHLALSTAAPVRVSPAQPQPQAVMVHLVDLVVAQADLVTAPVAVAVTPVVDPVVVAAAPSTQV